MEEILNYCNDKGIDIILTSTQLSDNVIYIKIEISTKNVKIILENNLEEARIMKIVKFVDEIESQNIAGIFDYQDSNIQ